MEPISTLDAAHSRLNTPRFVYHSVCLPLRMVCTYLCMFSTDPEVECVQERRDDVGLHCTRLAVMLSVTLQTVLAYVIVWFTVTGTSRATSIQELNNLPPLCPSPPFPTTLQTVHYATHPNTKLCMLHPPIHTNLPRMHACMHTTCILTG